MTKVIIARQDAAWARYIGETLGGDGGSGGIDAGTQVIEGWGGLG